MNQLIKRLKVKIVALSMSSLLLLLVLIVTSMNLLNFSELKDDADEILSFLAMHQGRFPVGGDGEEGEDLPPHMSPELPYESRFFSASVGEDGEIAGLDMGKIAAVDREEAVGYIKRALAEGDEHGFVDRFRYYVYDDADMKRIIMLDYGRQLDVYGLSLFTSVAISSIGFVVVFIVMILLSERILRPVIESHEKQKRFITDAGHEIKTPLTIINANADILEMDFGENDALSDIKAQTRKLSKLTGDLVSLSRMNEGTTSIVKVEFPISEIVSDAAGAFAAPLRAMGKQLATDVTPLLSYVGDSAAVERVVTILLDNAMKYSSDGSTVRLTLRGSRSAITLTVENEVDAPVEKRDIAHIFDRFYRSDASRNSETGGHGIGLSIASMIVDAHGGRIYASSENKHSFKITAVFPQ